MHGLVSGVEGSNKMEERRSDDVENCAVLMSHYIQLAPFYRRKMTGEGR